jgi:hypothetical protein
MELNEGKNSIPSPLPISLLLNFWLVKGLVFSLFDPADPLLTAETCQGRMIAGTPAFETDVHASQKTFPGGIFSHLPIDVNNVGIVPDFFRIFLPLLHRTVSLFFRLAFIVGENIGRKQYRKNDCRNKNRSSHKTLSSVSCFGKSNDD